MLRRIIDVFWSGILLVLAIPIFLVTALAVWITDRGPVFYKQTRAGIHGRRFELLKFRSMRVNNHPVDQVEEVREEHPLVTPVGRWIRRFKIDELPQLLNVWRGDMTLIGPRPTIPEQVARYTAFQRRRLNMLPGMTGWAQVNGGAEISWPERIILEVWYVEKRTFWLDMKILWRTLLVILFGHKPNSKALEEALVYAHQQASAEELGLDPSLRAADGGETTRDLVAK